MSRSRFIDTIRRRWRLVLVGLILLTLGILIFRPMGLGKLTSHPDPVADYAAALQRIEALEAEEASLGLNPLCQLRFMSYGRKVDRAIVFVHGYTNCPQQFEELGRAFHEVGYNVLIVAAPRHGRADRLTTEQARLTAEELVAYTDAVVDIAQGLGEHVTLAGISMGGTATAWAAQHRSDLDLAVMISPAYRFQMIPAWVAAPLTKQFVILPNFYLWINSELKERNGPEYTYPRRSTRALAQTLRLGYAVRAHQDQGTPAAGSLLVITNAHDPSVDNGITAGLAAEWRASGAEVATYEFPAHLELKHDLIDPNQGTQEIVYPKLIELITAAAGP